MVFGWRYWEIRPGESGEPELCSVSLSHQAWGLRAERAECLLSEDSDHLTPDPDCSCGWHAYDSFTECEAMRQERFGFDGPSVIGAIAGLGRIEREPNGFRAERAEILGLVQTDPQADLVTVELESLWRAERKVSELYGVPLASSPEELEIAASR